jgi:hypothetical protein
MAERRDNDDIPYPAELAEYDPSKWKHEFDWKTARALWAKANNYPHHRLTLVQAMIHRDDAEGVNPEWDGVDRLSDYYKS